MIEFFVCVQDSTFFPADPTATPDGKLECNESFWWEGLEIIAPRPKLGLLGTFFDNTMTEELLSPQQEGQQEEESSGENNSSSSSSCTTSTSEGSEESNPPPVKVGFDGTS